MAQPGDVRGVYRQHSDHRHLAGDPRRPNRRRRRLYRQRRPVAVVHRAVRQLRGSAGRRPQQGPCGKPEGHQENQLGEKLAGPRRDGATERVAAESLRKGDIVLVEAGDTIPCDGEVLEGGASVDESAITGESAPVIRESGGDFSSVTGGTRVLSDWLVVQCSVNPGKPSSIA